MEKILRNCLKVLLVMVISISALNLGLVSALEENEDEVLVNYDDQVSGISDFGNISGHHAYKFYCDQTLSLIGTMTSSASELSITDINTYFGFPTNTIKSYSYVGAGEYAFAYTYETSYRNYSYGIAAKNSNLATISNGILVKGTAAGSTAYNNGGAYTSYVYVSFDGYKTLVEDAVASLEHNIILRNVTGGSLSSTVSKASAGSTVTVTASPSTGYSLSSATVSGATNVSVSRKYNNVYDAFTSSRGSTGMVA